VREQHAATTIESANWSTTAPAVAAECSSHRPTFWSGSRAFTTAAWRFEFASDQKLVDRVADDRPAAHGLRRRRQRELAVADLRRGPLPQSTIALVSTTVGVIRSTSASSVNTTAASPLRPPSFASSQ
jgi:hypothetical protein